MRKLRLPGLPGRRLAGAGPRATARQLADPGQGSAPRYFAFAFIFVFIGTLALRFLVTAPTIRKLAGARPQLAAAVDRRLLLTAAVTIALFIPATIIELANEGTNLFEGGDGTLWLVRLILTAIAAAAVIPAALMSLGGRDLPARRVTTVAAIGLTAGVAELLARVIPTETPDEWVREIFTDLLDFGHMTGASVWIGGLVALGVLAATLRLSASERDGFWSAALRRFSIVATVCVGVMILTGLWTAWIHVGPPRLLFHTLYGETLLVKLILVLILVGLGAINQLWLLPRVNALRAEGEDGSALAVTLRHFRGVIAAEAVIGLLVLLVVPFLSGSARKQEFERQAADLTQTALVGGQEVRLRPSGAQPGPTDYDVWAPGAEGVAVAFSSPKLGVHATEVPATSLGGDHYRVSGLYTPMVGDWRARVLVDGRSAASFPLAVTATYVEPESPAAAAGQGLDLGLGRRRGDRRARGPGRSGLRLDLDHALATPTAVDRRGRAGARGQRRLTDASRPAAPPPRESCARASCGIRSRSGRPCPGRGTTPRACRPRCACRPCRVPGSRCRRRASAA